MSPIALEAQNNFDYVLKIDRDKEPEKQPTFKIKFLTAREWRRLSQLHKEMSEVGEDFDKQITLTFSIISHGLIGWEKMIDVKTGEEIKFEETKIEDWESLLSLSEATELMGAVVEQGFDIETKKNSGSLSPSNTE